MTYIAFCHCFPWGMQTWIFYLSQFISNVVLSVELSGSFGWPFGLISFTSWELRVYSALLEISNEPTALLETWQPAAAIVHGCSTEWLQLKPVGHPCTGHILCPVFSATVSHLLHLECIGQHVDMQKHVIHTNSLSPEPQLEAWKSHLL